MDRTVLSLGEGIRGEFPLLANSPRLVYLDSAATAQKPRAVLQAMDDLYTTAYANVHRGVYALCQRATELYEGSREKLRSFLNARSTAEVIFTKGTTEGINLVAASWGRTNLRRGDEILLTIVEHHSNIVPWQLLAAERGATVRFAGLEEDGSFSLRDFERQLSGRTKLVACTVLANALGLELPLGEIVSRAKAVGALVLLDAAQAVAHRPLDVQALGADFVAFSGHKLYGPTASGVLYGREELLDAMPPFLGGGDMIRSVTVDGTTFNDLPYKFEAGTPAIAEAVGLGAAVDFVRALGLERIHDHEQALVRALEEELRGVRGVRVFGRQHSALVTFTVDGVHPHDLAQFLDQEEIAVRAGHHCAQPLMRHFGIAASARASFGVYNMAADVTRLVLALEKAKSFFG